MKKYSTSGINLGGGYIRMHLYLDILNRIEQKGVGLTSSSTIINSKSKYFIVDKKYESLCNLLLKKYEKKLNGVPLPTKLKHIAALCMLITIALASKENMDKSYAEEIALENIETHVPLEKEDKYEENDLELQKEIENVMTMYYDNTEEDSEELIYEIYLRTYSKYFHFDTKRVIELAEVYTNHYTNFEKVIPEYYEITSPECACMLFVYLLNRGDLDIECNKEELLTTQKITTTPHNNLNSFYLSTGEKYSAFVGHICDLFKIKDKSIALSASYTEISMQGSYSSNTRNNFGGMKYNGELISYPTPEAGIICFCANFEKYYNEYSMDTIEELACFHITGKKEMPIVDENDDEETKEQKKGVIEEIMRWIESVEFFYNEIDHNYDDYFLPNNQGAYVRRLSQNN